MNRLESEESREVIIYQIICDAVHLHNLAARSLTENGEFESDSSVLFYFDTIADAVDALNDAYQQAQYSTCPEMKDVISALDAYFAIFDTIFEDSLFSCALTDAEIAAMTVEAGQALLTAQTFSRRCLDNPQNTFGKIEKSSDRY